MAKIEFRDLRADEIECRIATVKDSGMSLLLYKDARCDMNILDETVGAFNWQRSHSRDNANCIVSIWDEDKKQWISKEDVGTESNTEAVKGLASDSFKRACFNWGIGRELYTASFIWVKSDKYNDKYDKFDVQEIKIENKRIVGLTIYNVSKGCVAFTMGKGSKAATAAAQPKAQPKAQAKKATVTPTAPVAPAAPANEPELPFEVLPVETNRDKFRKYIKENKLTDNQIVQILVACNVGDKSPDSEWEKALLYAIATKGGVKNA